MAVRIGVIGVGFGTRVHVPAYQKEGLEVVAVCSRREERAREAAEKFEIPHFFTDHHKMLEMAGLDAVAVVVPPYMHHDVTMDVLAARKHVICEKPFTTTLADAREMWKTAESIGVTAMVAHEFRFSPARAYAKQLIDQGYIGPLQNALITLMQASRLGETRPLHPFRDSAEHGGGLLWSQGSHNVDALRHWFGEVAWVEGKVFVHRPERIGEGGKPASATADDAFTMTIGFVDDGWATITANYAVTHNGGMHVELYGRDGTLITPHPNLGSPNPPPHPTLVGGKIGEDLHQLDIPAELDPYDDEGHDGLMPMRWLAKEFVRGIETGTSPAPSFYDGYRCQQVLHAVRESSETGRVIAIPKE